MKVIRDKLNNIDKNAVAHTTMYLVDRLQDRPKEVQVAAAAALFLLVAERFQVPAQEVFTVVKNMMNHADNTMVPEFRAVRRYLENEIA